RRLSRSRVPDPARSVHDDFPGTSSERNQSNPLRRLERLRHATPDRTGSRDPAGYDLLLLATELVEHHTRRLYRIWDAAKICEGRWHDDRRLSGRDANDRRVRPGVSIFYRDAA